MGGRDAPSEVKLYISYLLFLSSHIRFSTLENAYSGIIALLVNAQQEHLNLADVLNVQLSAYWFHWRRKMRGIVRRQVAGPYDHFVDSDTTT